MSFSYHTLARRDSFSCDPPSKRDDYGNCIDFLTEKWVLHGPKPILLAGFIISVLGGCWTIIFVGSEARAKKRAGAGNAVGWFKAHSLTGAMGLTFIYFAVDAYLRFLQYQQRTVNVLVMIVDLARTKPRGSSDWIVLTIILFNRNILLVSGTPDNAYFRTCRKIFMWIFTVATFLSAVSDFYAKIGLAVEVESKGSATKYLDVVPRYVTILTSALDTVSWAMYVLAGIFFISVAIKARAREKGKAHRQYSRNYFITAVAFFIRSTPGLVVNVLCGWFNWTRTYTMNFVDNTVYAVTTCTIYYFWSRLAKTPIDVDNAEPQLTETTYRPVFNAASVSDHGSNHARGWSHSDFSKQPNVGYAPLNPDSYTRQ